MAIYACADVCVVERRSSPMDETDEMFPGSDQDMSNHSQPTYAANTIPTPGENTPQVHTQFSQLQDQSPDTPTSQPGQLPGARIEIDGKSKNYHETSGYTWEKPEDEPGYMWKSRKGQEDMMRALESVVDREKTITGRGR